MDTLGDRMSTILPWLLAGALGFAIVQGSPQTPGGSTTTPTQAGAGAGPAPTAPPKPSLVFDASTPLTFETRGDSQSLARTVIVKNDTDKEQSAEFQVRLIDRTGASITAVVTVQSADAKIAPYDLRPMALRLSPVRSTGQEPQELPAGDGWIILKAQGQGGPGTARALKVLKPLPPTLQSVLIFGTLGLSVVLVALAYLSRAKLKLSDRMGVPEWGKSWASKATVASAFLTAVLSLAAFGDQTAGMHKTGYIVTAAVLTAVAALAPAVYAILQTPVAVAGGQTEYQGFVLTLLLSSVLSLWAAFGQLALLIFALQELAGFQVLSESISLLFQILVGALAMALIVYSANSIVQLLAAEPKAHDSGSAGTRTIEPTAARKPQWRPI